MSKVLKIDFHTHPIEGLRDQMGIKGIGNINKEVAKRIVDCIKSAGINGIAITEHGNFIHSWVTCLEILDHFRQERLVILPGTEVDYGTQQFLHIYIPDYYRRRIPFFAGKEWFTIMVHPGHYNPLEVKSGDGIPIDAVEEKSIHGTFPLAEQISKVRSIPVTGSSDAHQLEDIGKFYTEVELK
jgi:histidinol phosphatase-like PHP family hydrolase